MASGGSYERGIDYLNGESRRVLDKAVSGAALVAGALPIAVAATISAREHGLRNVLFTQKRVWGPDPNFAITKFRTLPPEINGGVYRLCDPRASKAANFMRRTGMDELPQLLDVWRGSMTTLGIRTVLQTHLDDRNSADPSLFADWYHAQQSTKPSLTGAGALWYHDADPDPSDPDSVLINVMKLDLEYIETASLDTDLKFLASIPGTIGSIAIDYLKQEG